MNQRKLTNLPNIYGLIFHRYILEIFRQRLWFQIFSCESIFIGQIIALYLTIDKDKIVNYNMAKKPIFLEIFRQRLWFQIFFWERIFIGQMIALNLTIDKDKIINYNMAKKPTQATYCYRFHVFPSTPSTSLRICHLIHFQYKICRL